MAIRLSDAAAALTAGDVGLRRALANAHMIFFTGTQPSSANSSAGTSQPIIAFTKDDGVLTAETRPQWELVLSGIAGTAVVTGVLIDNWDILGGSVSGTVLGTLTNDVATQINTNIGNTDFIAESDGVDTVTIYGPLGVGASMNSCILTATKTGTLTLTPSAAGAASVAGVTAANGLTFDVAKDGADLSPAVSAFYIAKPSGHVWKGKNGFGPATAAADAVLTGIVNGTTYTAGWGRICATPGDTGLTATSGEDGNVRVDFSIGTATEDFVMTPTASFVVNTAAGDEIESVINSLQLRVAKNPA